MAEKSSHYDDISPMTVAMPSVRTAQSPGLGSPKGPDDQAFQDEGREVDFGDVQKGSEAGAGSPAIQTRFSRLRGTVQQDPVQRQKTQIVQSCNTLDDFLPGFAARATCNVNTS